MRTFSLYPNGSDIGDEEQQKMIFVLYGFSKAGVTFCHG